MSDIELPFKHRILIPKQECLGSLLGGDEMAQIRKHSQKSELESCFDERMFSGGVTPLPCFFTSSVVFVHSDLWPPGQGISRLRPRTWMQEIEKGKASYKHKQGVVIASVTPISA